MGLFAQGFSGRVGWCGAAFAIVMATYWRRLVEVARTLASEPKVFLFDEVGSGLDEEDLYRLEQAMDLIRRAGGTVVLVEP